jgi:hypothetical protein
MVLCCEDTAFSFKTQMAGNSLRLFGNYFLPAGYEHQHLLMQTRGSVFHGIEKIPMQGQRMRTFTVTTIAGCMR